MRRCRTAVTRLQQMGSAYKAPAATAYSHMDWSAGSAEVRLVGPRLCFEQASGAGLLIEADYSEFAFLRRYSGELPRWRRQIRSVPGPRRSGPLSDWHPLRCHSDPFLRSHFLRRRALGHFLRKTALDCHCWEWRSARSPRRSRSATFPGRDQTAHSRRHHKSMRPIHRQTASSAPFSSAASIRTFL